MRVLMAKGSCANADLEATDLCLRCAGELTVSLMYTDTLVMCCVNSSKSGAVCMKSCKVALTADLAAESCVCRSQGQPEQCTRIS